VKTTVGFSALSDAVSKRAVLVVVCRNVVKSARKIAQKPIERTSSPEKYASHVQCPRVKSRVCDLEVSAALQCSAEIGCILTGYCGFFTLWG
jgi:hypothetical protein